MDKIFVMKLIEQCFTQYEYERTGVPPSQKELEAMADEIMSACKEGPDSLNDRINDAVYEYITG